MESERTEISNLLTDVESAQLLNLSVQTLRNWRSKRIGPPYIKLGRAVRYKLVDLLEWVEKRAVDPERSRHDELSSRH